MVARRLPVWPVPRQLRGEDRLGLESKPNTCDVLPRRRPRGPALVEGHRARAARERTGAGGDR